MNNITDLPWPHIMVLALSVILCVLNFAVAFAILELKRTGHRIEKAIKRWR